jgi:transposase-like protein
LLIEAKNRLGTVPHEELVWTPKGVQKRDTKIYSKKWEVSMSKLYTDEYKLSVVLDYYNSPLGVRAITQRYNLPSKNYIGIWEKSLKKKGLLSEDATKPKKSAGRSKESIMREDTRTPREKQYEEEIQTLKARISYFEGLDYMQPFIKKKETSAKRNTR